MTTDEDSGWFGDRRYRDEVQEKLTCALVRGGTSKGVLLPESAVPSDRGARERFLLALMGDGATLQVDGLGGNHPLTNKVMLVSRGEDGFHDVTYTYCQVGAASRTVSLSGNCGNMTAGVAAFAAGCGVGRDVDGASRSVRMLNTNTRQSIEAIVPMETGSGRGHDGGHRAAGGQSHRPIELIFRHLAGSVTGHLLPTGSERNVISLGSRRKTSVSIVDFGNLFLFIDATDWIADEQDAHARQAALASLLSELSQSPELLGLLPAGSVTRKVRLRFAALYRAAPSAGQEIGALMLTADGVVHNTYAVTGAFCVAAATKLPGSVAHDLVAHSDDPGLRIHHSSGHLDVSLVAADGSETAAEPEGFLWSGAKISRSARVLLVGDALIQAAASA